MNDDESLAKALELVSKRNPEALEVCLQLHDAYGEWALLDFGMLLGLKITGKDICDLYQSCNRDIQKVHECLMDDTAKQKLQEFREGEDPEMAPISPF